MSEVVKKSDIAVVDVPSSAVTPMEMIANAIQKGLPIDYLNKLMDLQERYQSGMAKAAYDADMAAMQGDLPVVEKRREGHGWKYADWGDIKREVNPVLQKHGFAITHRIEAGEKEIVVTAICSHRDGHREETSLPLPYDTSGSKNTVQARGSSVQYGIRYTGCAIAGIAIGGEDKDGADAGDEYDLSPWTERLAAAGNNLDEIAKIGADIKSAKDIPDGALKTLRSAWASANNLAKKNAAKTATTENADNA